MDRQPLTDRLGDRFLTEYGGATAAYSLRALNGNGDNVVRVRRSSDNFEQDFTASQVSDGTLESFCGVGDGFVETWYGQVPIVNSSNPTSTGQPKIVSNGALIEENGVAIPLWDGSNNTLRIAASDMATPTTQFQVSIVCKNNKSSMSSNEYLFGQYESTPDNRSFALYYRSNERLAVNFGDPSNGTFQGAWSNSSAISVDSLLVVGATYNAGTVKLYVNGVEVPSSLSAGTIPVSLFNTSSDYTIGSVLASNSPAAVFDGKIGEIYFAKNLDDDITAIQQAQMEAWGIS